MQGAERKRQLLKETGVQRDREHFQALQVNVSDRAVGFSNPGRTRPLSHPGIARAETHSSPHPLSILHTLLTRQRGQEAQFYTE